MLSVLVLRRLHESTYCSRRLLNNVTLRHTSIIGVLDATPILTQLGQMAGESQEGSGKSRRKGSSLA